MADNEILITVNNLSTYFFMEEGVAKAVNDVSFSIKKGKTFALVGESGCGKSVTALSLMGLIPDPPGKVVSGEVIFDGMDLLKLNEKQMRQIRGNRIAMIFQEPMTSLNPVFTVGNQIAEAISLHQKKSSSQAWAEAVEMLAKVRIADPEQRIVEVSGSKELFERPLHPYTQGLLKSLPSLGFAGERLETIAGVVPDPLDFPSGCKFHPRCPIGFDDKRCSSCEPGLREVQPGRFVACWYAPGYETQEEFKEYESKYGKHKQISA